MAKTSRAERNRRRESALALVSQGKGFSDVVTAQKSHGVLTFICHMATSLQRMSPKAEESGQFAASVCDQKMLYELLLHRKLDHEAAKASRPDWGYRHGNTR